MALARIACSTCGCPRVASACVLASTRWPTNQARKLAGNATATATTPNTAALDPYRIPRLGMTVSVVLTACVEYSEVIVRAPSTAMISWPNSTRPSTADCVGSKPARDCADVCGQWAAVAAQYTMLQATLARTSIASVQYVERTEMIFVNSERSVPGKPARLRRAVLVA